MTLFTPQEVDAFIAAESRYHPSGLTREQAVRFMTQRWKRERPMTRGEKDAAYLREAIDHYGGCLPRNLMNA